MEQSVPAALSHGHVWAAIDRLATRYAMTPSALARKAGLDATAFNRSKRIGRDGRPRWPSMESVAKVLEATGATLGDFLDLVDGHPSGDALPPVRSVPIIATSQAGQPGFFDAGGLPTGPGWDRVAFPAPAADRLYALDVRRDELAPLYRDGDVILVAPEAEMRRGDRVLVRTRAGGLQARVLAGATATGLNVEDGGAVVRLPRRDILWVARIVWASQ